MVYVIMVSIQMSETADIMSAVNTNIITSSRVNRQAYRQHHREMLGMELTKSDASLSFEEVEGGFEVDELFDDYVPLSLSPFNQNYQLNTRIYHFDQENGFHIQIKPHEVYQNDKLYTSDYPTFHPKHAASIKSVVHVLDDPLTQFNGWRVRLF